MSISLSLRLGRPARQAVIPDIPEEDDKTVLICTVFAKYERSAIATLSSPPQQILTVRSQPHKFPGQVLSRWSGNLTAAGLSYF